MFVVPPESTIIDFNCAECGQRISALKIHGGKKVICAKCRNTLIVPAGSEPSAESVRTVRFACSMCHREIEEPESSRGKLVECPHCRDYVPVPIEERPAQEAAVPPRPGAEPDTSDQRFEQLQGDMVERPAQEPDRVTERKLPWVLDIFLYPTSKAGLITLAIIIFVPLLIGIAVNSLSAGARGFPPLLVLAVPVSIIGMITRLLLSLYLYWYFCECIRDSAAGGVRAPETVGATPGLGDLLWQWFRTFVCLVVSAAPTLIYYAHVRQIDSVFWALLAVGVFVFPMALLAVVMFDSFAGLSPILLVGSVFSTFLPYCAMIAIFALLVVLIVQETPVIQGSAILSFTIRCVGVYLVLVVAHLLGWFYHRYEQKLNWDV
jgi:DNA-directed RNA polymerase subunit RPC12/RpoP